MTRVISAARSVTLLSAHQKTGKEDRPKLTEKAYVNAHTTMEEFEPTSSKANQDGVADTRTGKNPYPAFDKPGHHVASVRSSKCLIWTVAGTWPKSSNIVDGV